MERVLILLAAALMVYVAPSVKATAHLSFSDEQVNITRDGCGVTKLCVETPDDCDPAGNSNCLFVSVVASTPVAPGGTNLAVELSGESMGYIALGLTVNALQGTTMLFICAQNNGSFAFQTLQRNNSDQTLTPTERIVNEIRGMVNGSMIQCEFNIPNVNATSTRTSHVTTFIVLLGTGTFGNDGAGPLNVSLSRSQNLADPASNLATTAAPSTVTMAGNTTIMAGNTTVMAGTTTASSSAIHPHAALLLSVLTLSVMLRA